MISGEGNIVSLLSGFSNVNIPLEVLLDGLRSTIIGTSVVVCSIGATAQISSDIVGTSTTTASIIGKAPISADIIGTSTTTADLKGTGVLASVMVGTSTVTVDVTDASSFDDDAQAFFDTYSITDETTQNAINQLVLNLKGTGGDTTNSSDLWVKRVSIKPCIGTTATHQGADLSGNGFDSIFVNSPTMANAGTTVNGSTQYVRLAVIPSIDLAKWDVTICISNSTDDAFRVLIGAQGAGGTSQDLSIQDGGGSLKYRAYVVNATVTADTTGFILGTRRASNDLEIYRNGTSIVTNTGGDTGTQPDVELYAGALNSNGTATQFFGSTTFNNIGIFSGVTDNEAQDMYDSFAQFDIDMGR